MNWNEFFKLAYEHPFATFFFLLAIACIVGAFGSLLPWNKEDKDK